MNQTIVRYNKVSKSYGDLEVLKDINFSIKYNEKVALIGRSGSGKTTLARLLMTLEEPTSGTIEVENNLLWHEEVNGKLVRASEKHLHKIRRDIGMVFQHFHLFPHMTVLQNVIEALITVQKLPKSEAEGLGKFMLGKVGMIDKIDNYPAQLSGGQKQRVAIARALVMKPRIMIFDEPTSALDPELVGEVLDVIKEIALEDNMAMLLITHEMDFARDIADRIAFFEDGSIMEEGTPNKIFNYPETSRLESFLSRFNAS